MSLELSAQFKRWTTRAYINGQPQRLALPLPSRRIGFDTARSTAEMTLMDVPPTLTGQDAFIDVGWNGELVRFFTGRIDQPSAAEPNLQRKQTLVDENGKLRRKLTANIVWNNRNYVDAIFDVLIQVGADRVSYVYDPGLLLGPDYPITIDASKETAAEVFRQLLEYGGCTAWTAPDGAMRIENITGIPSTTYATLPDGTPMIYAYGASGSELGITGSSFVMGSAEGLTTSVTITGPKRTDGITPTGSATFTGVEGESFSANMRFVQNGTDAQTVAVRELSKRGVNKAVVSMSAPFNPYLLPGQTIGYRDERVGYSETVPAFVWAVNNNGPEMSATLYVGAHEADGYEGPVAPVAVATVVQVEVEPILISGSYEQRYFVQMDGSTSYAPTGTIISYEWSAPGATPSTSTDPRPLFVYSDISNRIISLTVGNDTGQENTVSIPVPTTESTIVTRQLSIAEGSNGWAVLLNGTGWHSLTRAGQSCTAVPSFNENGSLLSGWSDGKIFTLDTTNIPPILVELGSVTGAVTAIFPNETDPTNVLVTAGTKLFRSTNGASSFTQVYDFGVGFTTHDVQSSPSDVNEIRLAAGGIVFISFDGGVSFDAAINGASGTTALMLASAPWGHAAVFSGGASPTDAIKFEEGYGVAWTEVVSPPSSLTSIYALLATPGFVVGDGAGKLYLLSQVGVNFNATLLTPDAAAAIPDAIRDGQLASLAYLATASGSKKLVNNATLYDIRANAGLQIGYGQLANVASPAGVLILRPTLSSATTGGVWVYDLRNRGDDAFHAVSGFTGKTAISLVANPFDPDEWLLLTYEGTLYRTANAGLSWTSITLTGAVAGGVRQVEFSTTTNGAWFVGGMVSGNGIVWKGSGTTVSGTVTCGLSAYPLYVAAGMSDEILISGLRSGYGGYAGYITSGGTYTELTPKVDQFGYLQMERQPGAGRAMIGVLNQNTGAGLTTTLDYRLTTPAVRNAAAIGLVSATATLGYARGTTGELTVIANPYGTTPTFSTVTILDPGSTGTIYARATRVDRQTRTVVGAVIGGTSSTTIDVQINDGTGWQRVAGPAGLGFTDLENVIEVVKV